MSDLTYALVAEWDQIPAARCSQNCAEVWRLLEQRDSGMRCAAITYWCNVWVSTTDSKQNGRCMRRFLESGFETVFGTSAQSRRLSLDHVCFDTYLIPISYCYYHFFVPCTWFYFFSASSSSSSYYSHQPLLHIYHPLDLILEELSFHP